MEGSPFSNPMKYLLLIPLAAAAGAALLAAPVLAAEPSAVGLPTPLFTPSPTVAPSSPQRQPVRAAAITSPGKHPAPPVQRIPLDGKPLIPPAQMPAKLGPTPEARPALSLETDLQPLAPASLPSTVKPPSS